jgi:hypothetical protein
MGAWGVSAYENDTASDWLLSVVPSRAKQKVRAAFSRIERAEFADSDTACIALAACELVASASGHPHESQPDSFPAVAYKLSRDDDLRALRNLAVSVVEKVSGLQSELAELWRQAGDADWLADCGDLRDRLSSPLEPVEPPPRRPRRRRPKLGQVFEFFDSQLGYGYVQFVATTQSADVVLVLPAWFSEPQTPAELEVQFAEWTAKCHLQRTWLPPEEEHKVLGPVEIAPQATGTIWMRGKVLPSKDSPHGWFIQRDYADTEEYHPGYSETEFADLYPESDPSTLAPWAVSFSVLYGMKEGFERPE